MPRRGKLISFEGGEGAGKSVQVKRLRDRLSARGKNVVVVREPGGSVISEKIRQIVLSPKNTGMAYTTEVLLFQAARSQIYREIINPSLKLGKYVLADRTRDSSVVYQGIVRGFGRKLIEQLNDFSTESTYPDLTILLDIPVEAGLSRRNKSEKMDRLDMETKEFHEKVRAAYLNLVKNDDRKRWVIIDARQYVEDIEEEIWEVITKRKIFK